MSVPLLAVGSLLWPVIGPEDPVAPADSPAETAYRALPDLPIGAAERGRAPLEASALELARVLRLVVLDEAGTPCPDERLEVSWEVPAEGFRRGGYVEPLGPPPTAGTDHVNGIVLCDAATFSYVGFEAHWDEGRWQVSAVPQSEAEHDHEPVPEPAPPAPSKPVPAVRGLQGHDFGAGIEGFAAYEPQRTCDPTPKPGTLALRNMLLSAYPGSRSLGIGTACRGGDVSEHHEGRAFDWGVRINVPAEKAMADDFIAKTLAGDGNGHAAALARRMGIMYLIWNRRIWGSYRPEDGWRPYGGVSPHTDHVHISMSWAGGMGRTSFWTGTVAPNIPTATVLASAAPRTAVPTTAPPKRRSTTTTATPTTTTLPVDPEVQRQLDEERQRRRTLRRESSTTTAPSTSTSLKPTTSTTMRPSTTTTVRPSTTTTTAKATTTSTTAKATTTTTTAKATTTTTTAKATTTTTPASTTTTTAKATTTTTVKAATTTTSTTAKATTTTLAATTTTAKATTTTIKATTTTAAAPSTTTP